MNMEISKNHAEFLARSIAKRNGQILIPGSTFSKLDDTGLHLAFKVADMDRSDWAFADFEAEEVTV